MSLPPIELLLKEGLISADGARRVVAERQTGEGLTTALIRLGLLSEDDLLDFLSRKYGVPKSDLARIEALPEALRLVPKEIAQKYQVFPIRKVGNTITVAISDPTVVLALDDLQFATGLHVIPVLVRDSAIRAAIDRYYTDVGGDVDDHPGVAPTPPAVTAEELLSGLIDDLGTRSDSGQCMFRPPIAAFEDLIRGGRLTADAQRARGHLTVCLICLNTFAELRTLLEPPSEAEIRAARGGRTDTSDRSGK